MREVFCFIWNEFLDFFNFLEIFLRIILDFFYFDRNLGILNMLSRQGSTFKKTNFENCKKSDFA